MSSFGGEARLLEQAMGQPEEGWFFLLAQTPDWIMLGVAARPDMSAIRETFERVWACFEPVGRRSARTFSGDTSTAQAKAALPALDRIGAAAIADFIRQGVTEAELEAAKASSRRAFTSLQVRTPEEGERSVELRSLHIQAMKQLDAFIAARSAVRPKLAAWLTGERVFPLSQTFDPYTGRDDDLSGLRTL